MDGRRLRCGSTFQRNRSPQRGEMLLRLHFALSGHFLSHAIYLGRCPRLSHDAPLGQNAKRRITLRPFGAKRKPHATRFRANRTQCDSVPKAHNVRAQGNALGMHPNATKSPNGAKLRRGCISPLWGLSFPPSFTWGVAPGYHIAPLWGKSRNDESNSAPLGRNATPLFRLNPTHIVRQIRFRISLTTAEIQD